MKRQYESLIKVLLADFPCVVVLGPRQCAKTTLLHTLGTGWRVFDLERQSDHEVIAGDPDLFLRLNPRGVALDEAQLLPALFPALRVAIVEMAPFSFAETRQSFDSAFFDALKSGPVDVASPRFYSERILGVPCSCLV